MALIGVLYFAFVLLVIFIIYMPKGILGKLLELAHRRAGTPPPGRLRPASEAAD